AARCWLGWQAWRIAAAMPPSPRQKQAKRMYSWRVLFAMFWKLALQQTAQQVGHGQALREGRHLDARPHGGGDVQRQAGGVAVALVQCAGLTLTNPGLGVRIRGRTRADSDAFGRTFAVRWRLR